MADFEDSVRDRNGFGALILIIAAIVPGLVIDSWLLSMGAGALGGVVAGLVGGRSRGARIRYCIAASVCAAGSALGQKVMPELVDSGKYVNTLPALLGGLLGAFIFFMVREDAVQADRALFEKEKQ